MTVCRHKLRRRTLRGRRLPARVGGFGGNRMMNVLKGAIDDTEYCGRPTITVYHMTLLPTKSNRSSAPVGGMQAPFMLGDADLCGVDFGDGRRRTSHRSQRPRRKILRLLQMFALRRGISSQSREPRGNDDHLCSSHRTIASLPKDGTRRVNWSARRLGSARWSRTKKRIR